MILSNRTCKYKTKQRKKEEKEENSGHHSSAYAVALMNMLISMALMTDHSINNLRL